MIRNLRQLENCYLVRWDTMSMGLNLPMSGQVPSLNAGCEHIFFLIRLDMDFWTLNKATFHISCLYKVLHTLCNIRVYHHMFGEHGELSKANSLGNLLFWCSFLSFHVVAPPLINPIPSHIHPDPPSSRIGIDSIFTLF